MPNQPVRADPSKSYLLIFDKIGTEFGTFLIKTLGLPVSIGSVLKNISNKTRLYCSFLLEDEHAV